MSNLYFTIGLPRSGKSTFCNKWVTNSINILDNNRFTYNASPYYPASPPRTIVCADSIRLALTGERWNLNIEDIVDVVKHTMIKSLLLRGMDVIVDGTHTTLHNIKKLFRIDNQAKYVFIDTSAEICRNRAIADNMSDLIPVIDRMENQRTEHKFADLEYTRQQIINKIYQCRFDIASRMDR
jgi:predicted kinase